MSDEPKDIRPFQIETELHACPDCDYKGGFHVSFIREEGKLRIVLICPSCMARLDINRFI